MTKCSKCDGTGLLPLIKPDGTISRYAKVFCECHEDEPSHDYCGELNPSDFDFAMSDSFRGFSYQYCGQPDPGYTPREVKQEPQVVEHIHRHSSIGRQEFAKLQDMSNEIKYLRKRLTELQTRKQGTKKKRYVTYKV